MSVAVLIPAYNEADTIAAVVKAAAQIKGVERVVVINDGSTDNTAELAVQAGALVLDMPANMGKGAALNKGWSSVQASIYLLLDGDLGDTARLGEQLLIPVISGQADMTIAHFAQEQGRGGGTMGFGVVRRFAAWAIKHYTGISLNSPLSGQRAVRREVLEAVGGFAPGFGVEIALTLQASWAGFRIQEVSLPMQHRATGRGISGFCHRGRQFVHIISTLRRCLKERSDVC